MGPWVVLRPAAWIRHSVRDLTISQILAGTIGLVIGLLIAALVSIPLSRLPYPFGDILPTLAALFLGVPGHHGDDHASAGYVRVVPQDAARYCRAALRSLPAEGVDAPARRCCCSIAA